MRQEDRKKLMKEQLDYAKKLAKKVKDGRGDSLQARNLAHKFRVVTNVLQEH